jgi:hypothetical protein
MTSSRVEPIMIDMKRIGRFTIINNGKFAIRPRDSYDDNDPEEQTYSPDLYIKEGFELELDESSPLKKFMNMGLIVEYTNAPPKKGFTAYRFFRPLEDSMNFSKSGKVLKTALKPMVPDEPDPIIKNENDCLKFGEAMGIAIRSGDIDYVIRHLQTDVTKPELCVINKPTMLFGDDDDININLYKKTRSIDNKAIPNPGEAYAIVRREIVLKRAPYHIAFVIYQENGINITLEAEADAGREYLPHFAFYDTNPNGYTFHRRWAGDLPGDTVERKEVLYNNGNTIILQPTPSQRVGTKRKRGGKSMKKPTLRKQNKNRTIKAK